MFKKLFFSVSLSLMTVAPLSAYSLTVFDNAALARLCHEQSNSLKKIKSSQINQACENKVNTAAIYSETAGKDILNQKYQLAKYYLKASIHALKYTEGHGCEKQLELTKAKNELIQIKNQIINH